MHRHRWEEARRYFVPPPSRAVEGTFSRDERARLSFGFTVVELRCSECGDIKSRELPGNAVRGGDR